MASDRDGMRVYAGRRLAELRRSNAPRPHGVPAARVCASGRGLRRYRRA